MSASARLLLALLTAAVGAHAETIAIINAKLETVSAAGPIASGTLVMADGRITAVGASVKPPAGARVIDAAGHVVTPGFIASSTNIMLDEVNMVAPTRDDASGNAVSAGFDVQYGLNTHTTLIRVARQTGVTQAAITPMAGRGDTGGDADDAAALEGGGEGGTHDPALFAGQAAIVRLADGDPDPLVRSHIAMALDLGEAGARVAGSRGATIVLVKSALEDARHFARNRAAYELGHTRAHGLSRIDLEALVPVVEGRVPLLVRVNRASDIRQALQLAREQNVSLILEDAAEGWMVAAEIAAARVPVILDAQQDLPSAFESLASRLDNAARLQKAGVIIALKGKRNFNSLRPIRIDAGTAVAYGLPYQAALAAITINAARIWGVADRSGSLEVGKNADIVLWSGDPLEIRSRPLAVFIGGVEQPAASRRLELRDRYLKADDGYPPAYH
jgi:imidazolonepropionase-like amidohydrolase